MNTHIYIINQSGLLSIQLYGSGVEFDRSASAGDKYIIIYKLFDQLP